MKSSDVQQQFLSAMRNAKFGLFRNHTGLAEIRKMLGSYATGLDSGSEIGLDESAAALDGIVFYFENETQSALKTVRVTYHAPRALEWHRRVNLGWLGWATLQSSQDISDLMLRSGIEHKIVVYSDNSWSVVRIKGSSTIKIVYDEEGECVEVVNGFRWPESMFTDVIQELRTVGS